MVFPATVVGWLLVHEDKLIMNLMQSTLLTLVLPGEEFRWSGTRLLFEFEGLKHSPAKFTFV
jgi:hypothetical protein